MSAFKKYYLLPFFSVISLMLILLCIGITAHAQKVVIGRVLDENTKSALPFAKIISQKDTAITDSAGGFIITVHDSVKRIVVVSTGFQDNVVNLRPENDLMLTVLMQTAPQVAVYKHPDSISPNDTNVFVGQLHKIVGYAIDAATRERLPGVSLYMKEEGSGTTTDLDGNFELLFYGDTQTVAISSLSYINIDTVFRSSVKDSIVLALKTFAHDMKEVVIVASKKGRYRNKNNPAVDLIKKVIDRKSSNRMESTAHITYDLYDKMVMSTSNLPKFVKRFFLFKKFRFLFQNEDTFKIPGRRLLPVFVSERMSTTYIDNVAKKKIGILHSEKRMRFNSDLIESGNITDFLDRLYDQVDIYDNKMRVLNNYFLSPISDVSPLFYKFYIIDTSIIDGRKMVQMQFEPRNKRDFVFEGRMFISLNDYAVTDAYLAIPKGVNLNWANKLNIDLGFVQQDNGKYIQNKSRYFVEFGLLNSKQGVVGDRLIVRSNFDTSTPIPDSIFVEKPATLESENDTLYQRSNAYWENNRPEPLTVFEDRAYKNVDSLRNMPAFKSMMNTAYTFATGYKNFEYFELGSIYDLFTQNPLEGPKVRLGARSNIKKWQRVFFQAYTAYGFKDKQLKYYAGGTFSLPNKYVFGFPMHYIRASYQRDTRMPGQSMGFQAAENVFNYFKRNKDYRLWYNDLFSVEYQKEFQNHISLNLSYNWWKQEAPGSMAYVRADGSNDSIKTLTTHLINLKMRWSPNEKFIQNKRYRTHLDNGAGTFLFNATFGFNQGFAKQTIPYQIYQLGYAKRIDVSPLGRAYLNFNSGYLNGNVPYPLLFLPPANESYIFNTKSFNLMNSMEFIYDRFVSLNIDYHMRGFLFNRIPLIRAFYFREVFGFSILYGSLRKENLPQNNTNLILFPTDANGNSIISTFGKMPYIEANVGIENVFKVMRIDFVKRFTYTKMPNISPYGIRFSFTFDN